MADPIERELRRLARLFKTASASLEVIADELQRRDVKTEALPLPRARPAAEEPEPVEPTWDALVSRALELLRAEPERVWKPAELVRTVRDSGIPLASLQGVHFGLMPRLRQLGAIVDVDDGFTSREATGVATAASAPSTAEPREEVPWEAVIDQALALLRATPERVWKPAELTRAVRDAGVALSSLQGVHFGLMARLRALSAIEEREDGFVPAGSSPGDGEPDRGIPSRAPRLEPEPQTTEPQPALEAAAPEIAAEAPPDRNHWPELISTAMKLLRADPAQRWDPSVLVREARSAGVLIESVQGVQFELASRLVGLGMAEQEPDGMLRLGELAGGRVANATPRTGPPAAPREPADAIDALAEEIDACEMFLGSMSDPQRNAQVAIWAGRARELQDEGPAEAPPSPERASALRRVFGRLTRITREHRCGWVDALTPDWVMNWAVYIEFHSALLADEEPALTEAELQAVWRGKLRGLLLPARKHVSPYDAAEVIAKASALLPSEDQELADAVARFGPARVAAPPLIRRAAAARESVAPAGSSAESGSTAAEGEAAPGTLVVPEAMAKATRGLRALIVGGQGAREEHRRRHQAALGFSELDWEFSERGQASHYARLEERVKSGSYDLVFFLAGYTSHKSVPFLRQCKASGVPLVYLARGYSLAQVVRALEEQWMPRQREGVRVAQT